jgi:hypothetical protein
MTCAFPKKGNCETHGCFRKRLGNGECTEVTQPIEKDKPLPDFIPKPTDENYGRLLICIGNKAYFNLK